jgi:hypothetical protein
MIVRFRNVFHAPGFGRRRFPAGVVKDVPEGLRQKLPASAVILDDYIEPDEAKAEEEERLAEEFGESEDQIILEDTGLSGFAEEEYEEKPVKKKQSKTTKRK